MHWLFCQKFILVATSLGSKMPKRKRGTKAEPLCSACGKHGHYASLCVLLAKAVLSQITKTTSVATLQKLLQNETPLNLQEGGKKQRCGKTKGRRGKRVTASQKKPKRTYVADRCVAERKRTPRPRKGPLMDSLVSMKPTLSALRHLRTTGWAWKPRCGCGSKVSRCSWKTCCSRGRGRIFFRCVSCKKWYDAMVWSHLPSTRLPLALLWKALQLWYQPGNPPTLSQVAHHLGVSGAVGGSLDVVLRRLRHLEAQLSEEWQQQNSLSGDLEADGTTLRKWKVRCRGEHLRRLSTANCGLSSRTVPCPLPEVDRHQASFEATGRKHGPSQCLQGV